MNAKPVPTKVARTGCGEFNGDTENLSTTHRQSNPQLTELQPVRGIEEVLSKTEFLALAQHLQNGNGPHDFVMGIAHADGTRGHYTATRRTLNHALESCWECVIEEKELPFSVALFPRNQTGMSSWCGFDIDAHTPVLRQNAEWVLRKLSTVILCNKQENIFEDLTAVIEDSGRGYHIWLIAHECRPVIEWQRLMQNILRRAGVIASRDGIELFPSVRSDIPGNLGHPLRLPGTANVNAWNPKAGTYPCSLILAESGLKRFVDQLPQFDPSILGSGIDNKRDLPFVIRSGKEDRAGKTAQPKPLLDHPDTKRVLETCAITSPSTRHNQLCRLVGAGFHHFSRKQLKCLAEHQFKQASPAPSSTLKVHLEEFENAYQGIMAQSIDRYSSEEKAIYRRFSKQREREAFTITQNFARLAPVKRRWGVDAKFPVSGLDLGTRLGVNTQTAYRIRSVLVEARCIKKVEECTPGVAADKFVWLLSFSDAVRTSPNVQGTQSLDS